MGDDADSDDDWETAGDDLPEVMPATVGKGDGDAGDDPYDGDQDGDDGWETKLKQPIPASDGAACGVVGQSGRAGSSATSDGVPLIVVDMTELSDGAVHSKFDANAVNDAGAAKELRLRIEGDYESYSKNAWMLSDRIVVPCGSSVWKQALAELRREKPGHYFCPVFPPKKSSSTK